MRPDTFVASTKYGEWRGSAAADNADDPIPGREHLEDWLRDEGHASGDEALVGICMDVGENYGRHTDPVHVDFVLLALDGHSDIPSKLEAVADPVEVKRVQVRMDVAEFLALFKRFTVAVSLTGSSGSAGLLDGRSVSWLGE